MSILPPKKKAGGAAFNLGLTSNRQAASSPPKSQNTRGSQVKKFVEKIRSSKTFNAASLKQLRLTIGSTINAEQRNLLEALLQEDVFTDDVKAKFETWLSKTRLDGEKQAPEVSKSSVSPIQLEGFRFVPQARGAIQILFDENGTRRSLTVTPGGKSLERHPDGYPDDADYCAMLLGLACGKLPDECSSSLYNYLAFITQRLNGQPMAQILGHVRQNLEALPKNFVATVYEGLGGVDEEAAELWKRTADVAGVALK